MLAICDSCLDQFVTLSYFNGIYSTFSWFAIGGENRLFNNAVSCCHNNIMIIVKFFDTNKCLHLFAGGATNQVDYCAASCCSSTLWNIIDLKPITFSLISEKQHIVMCVCYKKMFNKILFLAHGTLHTSSTSPLRPVGVKGCSFYVSLVCYC